MKNFNLDGKTKNELREIFAEMEKQYEEKRIKKYGKEEWERMKRQSKAIEEKRRLNPLGL